jgi:hypothetical protein
MSSEDNILFWESCSAYVSNGYRFGNRLWKHICSPVTFGRLSWENANTAVHPATVPAQAVHTKNMNTSMMRKSVFFVVRPATVLAQTVPPASTSMVPAQTNASGAAVRVPVPAPTAHIKCMRNKSNCI